MKRSLWIMLACVLGLSLYVMNGGGDDDLLAPAKQGGDAHTRRSTRAALPGKGTSSPAAKPDPLLDQALIDAVKAWRSRDAQARQDLPVSLSAWAGARPPPPPMPSRQAEALEPTPPTAPPFPHTWVGRFNDLAGPATIERAVLTSDGRTLLVKPGDVIEGQWRVDGIGGRTMTLTYLPLNQPQTVAMK